MAIDCQDILDYILGRFEKDWFSANVDAEINTLKKETQKLAEKDDFDLDSTEYKTLEKKMLDLLDFIKPKCFPIYGTLIFIGSSRINCGMIGVSFFLEKDIKYSGIEEVDKFIEYERIFI